MFPPSSQGQLQLISFKVTSKFNSRRYSVLLASLIVSLNFSCSTFFKPIVANIFCLAFLFNCSEISVIFCSRIIFYWGFSLISPLLMRTKFKPFLVWLVEKSRSFYNLKLWGLISISNDITYSICKKLVFHNNTISKANPTPTVCCKLLTLSQEILIYNLF